MKILQKKLCKKLEYFTNGKIKFNIIWSTKKPKALVKITLNVLVVSYTKEFAAEEIIPSVKS